MTKAGLWSCLLYLSYFIGFRGSPSSKCRTNRDWNSPQKNTDCKFPFKWGGKTHHKCIKDKANGGRPWCSTATDWKGEHIHGKDLWGICSQDCEGKEFTLQFTPVHHGFKHLLKQAQSTLWSMSASKRLMANKLKQC